MPLDYKEKQQIFSRFQDFQNRTCDNSIDADVTLELTTLGKSEKASGILQARIPSFVRYAVTDPLGRSLLLFASDGRTFTLVNSRKGEGYTGSTGSRYFTKYVPAGVLPEDVFSWLSGRLSLNRLVFELAGRGKDQIQAVWLQAEGSGKNSHHVLFDPQTERILRHLVADNSRDILFDVRYENYVQDRSRCPWPMKLTIESKEITGTVTLYYEQVYFNSSFNPGLFQLSLPPHFKIKSVE